MSAAVSRDIAELEQRLEGAGGTAEAALALELAARIDDRGNSATSVSMNAARLLEALEALRRRVPEARVESPLDEIRARRDRRLAGSAGA